MQKKGLQIHPEGQPQFPSHLPHPSAALSCMVQSSAAGPKPPGGKKGFSGVVADLSRGPVGGERGKQPQNRSPWRGGWAGAVWRRSSGLSVSKSEPKGSSAETRS